MPVPKFRLEIPEAKNVMVCPGGGWNSGRGISKPYFLGGRANQYHQLAKITQEAEPLTEVPETMVEGLLGEES